jgi:ABC-type Co2+ transport system permease subunit
MYGVAMQAMKGVIARVFWSRYRSPSLPRKRAYFVAFAAGLIVLLVAGVQLAVALPASILTGFLVENIFDILWLKRRDGGAESADA